MNLTYGYWLEAHELYQRIVDHYGIPMFADGEPDLVLYYDPEDGLYGWHEYGEMGVNFAICEDWADVVGTMIHEYFHSLQCPKRTDEPEYEEEAEGVALRDLHLFLHPLIA
jgi:hypothetical protein